MKSEKELKEYGNSVFEKGLDCIKCKQKHLLNVAKQTLTNLMFVLEDYTLWDISRLTLKDEI